MKKTLIFAVGMAVGSLVLSGSARAHHGDAGRYIEDVVEITGTVVETQLVNPHSILVLDVATDGKNVRWQAEMGGAQQLIKSGWTNDVKPGTKVTLTGRRLKSGAPYMNLTERARVILADSGKVVMQNANYGLPAPNAQKPESFRLPSLRNPSGLPARYGPQKPRDTEQRVRAVSLGFCGLISVQSAFRHHPPSQAPAPDIPARMPLAG